MLTLWILLNSSTLLQHLTSWRVCSVQYSHCSMFFFCKLKNPWFLSQRNVNFAKVFLKMFDILQAGTNDCTQSSLSSYHQGYQLVHYILRQQHIPIYGHLTIIKGVLLSSKRALYETTLHHLSTIRVDTSKCATCVSYVYITCIVCMKLYMYYTKNTCILHI